MAATRLLCLSYARAASSSKALGRAGWRNVCTSPSRLQGCMSAWVIDQYGTNGVLKYTEEISIPTVSSPQEVMIKVHAASLNPLDVSMRGKCWINIHQSHVNNHNDLLTCHCSLLFISRWLWSQAAQVKKGSVVRDGQ